MRYLQRLFKHNYVCCLIGSWLVGCIMNTDFMTSSTGRLWKHLITIFTFEALFAVQLLVLSQQFSPWECVAAYIAREWALVRVLRSNMVLQMTRQNEGAITTGALMGLNIVVALHMAAQVARRDKRHATQRALIWFFLLMDSHVDCHVVRLVEWFAAQPAEEK